MLALELAKTPAPSKIASRHQRINRPQSPIILHNLAKCSTGESKAGSKAKFRETLVSNQH